MLKRIPPIQTAMIGLLIMMGLGSCQSPRPDFGALIKQTQEAPYRSVIEKPPFEVSLTYRPAWLTASNDLKRLRDQGQVSTAQVAQVMATHPMPPGFVLVVSAASDIPPEQRRSLDLVNAHPDLASFTANLHHLMYGLKDKIYLLTEDRTKVPIVDYQLDRNWGIRTDTRFLITFPVQYEDKVLAKESSLEIVVQGLHSTMPELRFEFPQNPLKTAALSADELTLALNNWSPEPAKP